MKLKDMPVEEIELLSYTDLTYMLLKENKKPMNTPTIFKKICDLLGYSDSEFTDKIGDYYTSLTLDKRFVLLDSNEWDIRDHHPIEIVMDDDDEEEIEEVEEEVIEEEDNIDESIGDEDILDDDDDDMDDLAIVDEDDLEED